jgi:hypothetical protein
MAVTRGTILERVNKMRFMAFILTLLLASVHSYSKDINLADASYCIDWIDDEDGFDVRLALVEKHRGLKLSLNRQEPVACMGSYSTGENSYIFFIDKRGRTVLFFESLPWFTFEGSHGVDIRIDGKNNDGGIEIGAIEPNLVKTLPPELQIDFPDTSGYMVAKFKKRSEYKKKEILQQLTGKTLNAEIWKHLRCLPDIDTTYTIKFFVKVTGECKQ